MTTLDEIQETYERGDAALVAYTNGGSEIRALSRLSQTSDTVPKLIAALRAVEDLLAYWDTMADGDRYYAGSVRARIREALG